MALIDYAFNREIGLTSLILEYGKNHDYIFNDFKPFLKLKDIKDKSERKDVIRYMRRWRDRYLYKIVNNKKPNILEFIDFYFANWFSATNKVNKRYPEGHEKQGKRMPFRYKIGSNGKYEYESSGVKMAWFRSSIASRKSFFGKIF